MKTNLINDYKSFQGSYNKQMPLLIQEGLQPLTAKDVMEYRIKAIQSNNEDEFDFWLDHYFDTADGLAYHDNNLIVVPNSQELLNINPESKLSNGEATKQEKEEEKRQEELEKQRQEKVKAQKSELIKGLGAKLDKNRETANQLNSELKNINLKHQRKINNHSTF